MSDKFIVVASDKMAASGLEPLTRDDRFEVVMANGWEPERLKEVLAKAHGLIVRSATRVDRDMIAAAPNLRVVGRAGVGVDNIDMDAATERGIPVINAPEGNTVSAAELSMCLILAVYRKVVWADRSMRSGEWARSSFSGREIRGKTLALIGAGRIGGEVARRAQAFGMTTIAHDPYLTDARAEELALERVGLAELFARGDVISLHVPLTPATEGMIGRAELKAMKSTAILINVARGGVVDEDALIDALESEEIAGAALDVFASEPLQEGSRLREAPNLILTPHLGASTAEAQELVASEIAEGVRAALLEGDLSSALNAPAIGGDELKYLRPLLDLAGKIGRVAAVLGWGGMRRVEVCMAGSDEDVLRPLSAAALAGMLTPVVGRRNVNYVNALHIAESRGIEISTALLPARQDYTEFLEVVLETDDQRVRVAGALLGDQHHPRIVQIDDYDLSVKPEGCLLILKNKDVPGVIGTVGTLLGTHGLNIAEYVQSRNSEGGEVMAAVTVDGRLGSEILAALREQDDIFDARAVYLDS